MKTMKHVFYAGLTLMALASCSQEEIINADMSEAIGFRTSLGKTTRAEIKLNNLGSFNVTAFPTGEANYFTNLKVSSTDAGVTWKTASVHYWPASTLNFTAYAPESISKLVGIDKTAQKITGFQVEQTVASQKDVVAAFNKGSQATYGASGVPMNFKHILSQIEVKAKCTNSNLRVKVKGVKLGAIKSKGNFAFPQVETSSKYTVPRTNWTGLSTPKDFLAEQRAGASEVTLNGTAQSIMFGTDNFMMIPQKLEAFSKTKQAGAYIAVLCNISRKESSSSYTGVYPGAASTEYAFAAVGIDTDWQPGKKYIYTLEFGNNAAGNGGAGLVAPNQNNPNQRKVTTPKKPVSPYPHNSGDPILGQPIKFKVTVDNWSDQTSAINM